MNKIDRLHTWVHDKGNGMLINCLNGVTVSVTIAPGDDGLYICVVRAGYGETKKTKHETFGKAFFHADNEINRMNSIDVTWGDSLVFELGAMRAEAVEMKGVSAFEPKYSYALYCNGRFAGSGNADTIEGARRGVEDLVNGRVAID